MAASYDTGWENGKWFTNSYPADFYEMRHGEPAPAGMRDPMRCFQEREGMRPFGKWKPVTDVVMGPPIAEAYTTEQLEDMGMIGIYRISEDVDPKQRQKLIAADIRNNKREGADWILKTDGRRMNEYTSRDEYNEIMERIAGFIEIGQTTGICPWWELKLYD